MYGSGTMSAYQLSHGFSKPISECPINVPDDTVHAQKELVAIRKPTRIMRSKSADNKIVNAGDLLAVFIKKPKVKRENWSPSRIVINVDY